MKTSHRRITFFSILLALVFSTAASMNSYKKEGHLILSGLMDTLKLLPLKK